MSRAALPILLAAAAALSGLPAARAAEPFDPSGTLLAGTEVLPDLGKSPVSLHLGADGSAAGSFLDPGGLAFGWTGTWSLDGEGALAVDLDPLEGVGDPIAVSLRLSSAGSGKGTVTRDSGTPLVTPLKVKPVHPLPKARGWTALVPRMRDTGTVAAGEFRGTLLVRNLAVPKRKPKPLVLRVFAVSPAGLPGTPATLSLLPGGTARLEGGSLPRLPPGMEEESFQIAVTGGKGFDPALVEIQAIEEVLRGSDPAVPTAGTALPVRWVRGLPAAAAAKRERVPLLAPWFLDDGGAGALPRDAILVLRDMAPFSGGDPAGSVRVSVRTLAGTEVASEDVALPRGAAVEVRPLDLLASPGDLPGGEGQIRVTRTDGTGLPRDTVAAALLSTATSSSVPAAVLSLAVGHPDPDGPSARIVLPWFLQPDDGVSGTRVLIQNLGDAPATLPVEVRALDGTLLASGSLPVAAGATVRADPAALGMDPGDLPGGEGQILLGLATGLPRTLFLAHAEMRLAGTPDALVALPAEFEFSPAAGESFRVGLLDAPESDGSDVGDSDAWLFLRNGGGTAAAVTARVLDATGAPIGSNPDVPFSIAPGESRRISIEEVLALAGAPVSPGDDGFRGTLEVTGTGPGPFSARGVRVRYGPDGEVLPAPANAKFGP